MNIQSARGFDSLSLHYIQRIASDREADSPVQSHDVTVGGRPYLNGPPSKKPSLHQRFVGWVMQIRP